MVREPPARDPFVRGVAIDWEDVEDSDAYPFGLAPVRALDGLRLDPHVTFFVGENGSGKSTLVEAIAAAAGINPEGGTRNTVFATHTTESDLWRHLRLVRSTRRPGTEFFLRAESLYNVASLLDRMAIEDGRTLASYGGRSLHEQSHGESFLAVVTNRFGPDGFYVLDEPEAALSPRGCLALLARLHDLVVAGSQVVVATHSPILLAYPHATIHEASAEGLAEVTYRDTDSYALTAAFLEAPEAFLRHLLDD